MKEKQLQELLIALNLRGVVKRNNNLMACCPSHSENRPSWGISITGPDHLHGCFACGFKGTLKTLLLHMGWSQRRVDNLLGSEVRLELSFSKKSSNDYTLEIFDEAHLWPFLPLHAKVHDYLESRDFDTPNRWAKKFNLLYDRRDKRVVIPWYYGHKLVGATGRTIIGAKQKMIAYVPFKKSNVLYIPNRRIEEHEVILVEGEFDALKLASFGWTNVAALGHGRFGQGQKHFLLSLPVKKLILFFDDDERGDSLTEEVTEEMKDYCYVRHVVWSHSDLSKAKQRLKDGEKRDPGMLTSEEVTQALMWDTKTASIWPDFRA